MQRSLDSSERFMGPRDILSLHLYLKDKAMTQVSIRIAIHEFEFFQKFLVFSLEKLIFYIWRFRVHFQINWFLLWKNRLLFNLEFLIWKF